MNSVENQLDGYPSTFKTKIGFGRIDSGTITFVIPAFRALEFEKDGGIAELFELEETASSVIEVTLHSLRDAGDIELLDNVIQLLLDSEQLDFSATGQFTEDEWISVPVDISDIIGGEHEEG